MADAATIRKNTSKKAKDTPFEHFRISTGLKDLIGRDLITDDFVAVFELVKNAFDARAKKVTLVFEEDSIVISDDGKGMRREDILNKWLFVAYSAKRDGTEDADYRDRIGEGRRVYAGAKGVGRFSCDCLGQTLLLYSRARGNQVQMLEVDWRKYEKDPKQEFAKVGVKLGEVSLFPPVSHHSPKGVGTSLVIGMLRSVWDRSKLLELRRALSKLINPFSTKADNFKIEIVAKVEAVEDDRIKKLNDAREPDDPAGFLVNGLIENSILSALAKRTTVIRVKSIENGRRLETELEDRGDLVYRIREVNPYKRLKDAGFSSDVYFLNRSAKTTFARRMGVRSIDFGSIFAFRNGFRVVPIGNEDDDFFGLNKRKQQGQRRFLGTREVVGKVDVLGVPGFDEATSRAGGFIRSKHVDELITALVDKCIKRLERYVVDISWKDDFDKDDATTSRMRLDSSSAKIAQLVSRLAATDGVEVVAFNPDLVRIVDERSDSFLDSFRALELLAEKTGSKDLLASVDQTRARIEALQAAEAEARDAEQRSEARALKAEQDAATVRSELVVATEMLESERGRNSFLIAAASLDKDTILNLHHQIGMHAAAIQHSIKLMSEKLRRADQVPKEEIASFLDKVSFRNSQILTAARFASRGGYKEQAISRTDDLAQFIHDYTDAIGNAWAPTGTTASVEWQGKGFERKFKPIEVGIIIDNLVSNAGKAGASKLLLALSIEKREGKQQLVIDAADDGAGWAKNLKPLNSIFEMGVTTGKTGSGLGLYHVKQVVGTMGGTIEAMPEPYDDEHPGAHIRIRLPA
ncbi:sensor histidine kinase [Candidatus Phyllobacterium onerii]|uniref:ATP-binding protein n=1 Tax=Candidatus Phyllobacterium onerii TaxID=3020828 RepID=UPI00232F0D60|nr:sensor histidine kinase [Phyllobacterium sp. IY22]